MSGLRLALLVVVLTGTAFADSFEFLAYAPPKAPWTKQAQDDGRIIYSRNAPHGVGIILLIPSVTPIGTPTEEFETFWRAHVTPINKAPVPTPQTRPARDLTMVWGATQVDIVGAKTDIQVVMFVGRGSVLGTVTMTSGADSVRDVAAFNASVKILDANRPKVQPPAVSETPVSAKPLAAGELGVELDPPPGYTLKVYGGWTWLVPTKPSRDTACTYAVSPPRVSLGSLEKDAEAALRQLPPGWEQVGPSTKHHGVGATGWSYFFAGAHTRSTIQGHPGASEAMALALPAPNQQTTIVVGFGTSMACLPNDDSFSHLFHSLRPRGIPSDGGKALRTRMLAAWRHTVSMSTGSSLNGIMQYAFYPSGRYSFGVATSTQSFYYQYNYAGVGDGAWKLEGDVLTITPDDKDRGVQRFRVRVYTEYIAASWRDAIQLFDESKSNIVYYKILDDKPAK